MFLHKSKSKRAVSPSAQLEGEAQLLSVEQLVYDPKKSPRRRRRKLKIGLSLVAVALIVAGGFIAKAALSLHQVIQRNSGEAAIGLKQANLSIDQLKGEGDGRINILLLGIGDSDHDGADLTDSMMVMSLDPRNNEVAMLGIPRDLYVKIPGFGYDKINAANAYGDVANKDGGPELAKQVVSSVLDIPIHYFIRMNFTGFKKAVDSVKGVDIDVKQALYDPEYPCDYNDHFSCGFRISAGQQKLTGTTALKYVRCRKGDCGDDFGRAQRQQQVLMALRDKALQLNTLTNPMAISSLIDTIGQNVRTDLALWEIKRLAEIAKQVDQAKIVNRVIDNNPTGPLVRPDTINGASVVVPIAGLGNYKQIQALAHTIFADSYIRDENARIAVVNATGMTGMSQQLADLLKSYNYNVVDKSDALNKQSATQIIDYTRGQKPYTVKYLESRFGASSKQVDPPAGSNSAQIKVIVGSDYKS